MFESVGCIGCHTVNENPTIEEEINSRNLLNKSFTALKRYLDKSL